LEEKHSLLNVKTNKAINKQSRNIFNSEEFIYVKCKKPRNGKENSTNGETENREMELWRNREKNSVF
jgi:hypothetical protein